MLVRRPLASAALPLAAFVTAAAASCTFPTVDYEEAPSTLPACSATGSCADVAQRCGEEALKTQESCVHQCEKKGSACLDQCATALRTRLTQCSAACQSCAQAQGCMNAVASCDGLAGK